MATTKSSSPRRRRKLPETVREKAEKKQVKDQKLPRRRKFAAAAKPAGRVRNLARREYHPIKLPESKRWGRVLGKRRRFIPSYFRESWAELKLVKWPTRKETVRLTLAVFVFAVIFMIIIQAMDFVFQRLFKEILL